MKKCQKCGTKGEIKNLSYCIDEQGYDLENVEDIALCNKCLDMLIFMLIVSPASNKVH